MAQTHLSIKEYSKLTNIKESTLYANYRKGKLRNAIKIGGQIKILVDDSITSDYSPFIITPELVSSLEKIASGYNELLKEIKSQKIK